MTKQIKIPISNLMIHVARVPPVQVKERKVSAAIAITCILEESLFHVQIPEQKKKWKNIQVLFLCSGRLSQGEWAGGGKDVC